ncbi:hypothetical protein DYBT9275_03291 [Dyadobacter sp. CECT 9275]|uniref:Uncharacterized protein n=1 Tax=Dyadobacter helix TaxID=2822344 RepID=A0A916JHC8_9BACT|nr:hypothetical protein DYBT9275_03291 [Dyadobacter sp. CECT 9275]
MCLFIIFLIFSDLIDSYLGFQVVCLLFLNEPYPLEEEFLKEYLRLFSNFITVQVYLNR